MNHSDEITFLKRLVEDLKKAESYNTLGLRVYLLAYGITRTRLERATEVIAMLEQCSDKTAPTEDESLPTLEQVQNIYRQDP